jgi:hypothetical protein
LHPSPDPEEKDILRKVDNGLKAAVKYKGLDWEYGTKIKREKYCYLALNEVLDDIGEYITYSWYRFGFSAYASPTSPDSNTASTDSPLTSPGLRETSLYSKDTEEFKEIFLYELEDMTLNRDNWYSSDLSFLKRFYRLYAPTEYRQLYLVNMRLREIFEDAVEEVDSLIERNDEIEEQSPGYYSDVGEVVTHLHMELMSDESLSENLDEVIEYTDILEDAFMSLEDIPSSELNDSHKEALDELYDEYQDYIWTVIACHISMETADGPNQEVVVETSENKLESEVAMHRWRMKNLQSTCEEANLTPSVEDYPTHGDDMQDSVDDLLDTAEGRKK